MGARARDKTMLGVVAALAGAAMGWLGLYGFAWNDYEIEALPALNALIGGHLSQFFASAPVYGGSLLERAPFALAPSLWGGGELAVYRMMALPCLLVAAALGVWLASSVRTRARGLTSGSSRIAAWLALGLCVANPLALAALELGHPDELLGGALCVIAVLMAARGHAGWAGLTLGLAFANKEWAILALGPVLLALPTRRMLCASIASAVAVLLLGPFLLWGGSSFANGLHGAADPGSAIFQPWQLWWFLGHHGHVVRGLFGAFKPGYRVASSWIGMVSHPLVVGIGLILSVFAWLSARARERAAGMAASEQSRLSHALRLLALVLLVRCALDTWDMVYYPLPYVLALTAWETLCLRRMPVLALASTAAVWTACKWLPSFASADAQAAFFAAWSVPVMTWLAAPLLDGLQMLGKPRKKLAPLRRDGHQVLDAHAELS